MMWDYNGTWNSSDWVAMSLMMITLLGLFVVVVLVVSRWARRDAAASGTSPTRETAEQVLANRFARGEIEEEDYHRRLAVIASATARLV